MDNIIVSYSAEALNIINATTDIKKQRLEPCIVNQESAVNLPQIPCQGKTPTREIQTLESASVLTGALTVTGRHRAESAWDDATTGREKRNLRFYFRTSDEEDSFQIMVSKTRHSRGCGRFDNDICFAPPSTLLLLCNRHWARATVATSSARQEGSMNSSRKTKSSAVLLTHACHTTSSECNVVVGNTVV